MFCGGANLNKEKIVFIDLILHPKVIEKFLNG